MVNSDILSLSAAYNDTAPVGTLCYIDPEYQRTGVVSPKSDVYALGIIILQLLTGKPAIALAHKVENAIDNDHLTEMLDLEAGGWPIEETKNLALVALKCTEMRQRDRPDLEDEVLPVLEKLKDFAEKTRDLALVSPPPPPKHFTCPILNEVMADPCVAADGYTYDRVAIEAWLNEKDTSPIWKFLMCIGFFIVFSERQKEYGYDNERGSKESSSYRTISFWEISREMEKKNMAKDGLNGLKPSAISSVVAVAINGGKKSKYVIKWALENLIPEGGPEHVFKLLHVFPEISIVPTPMGTGIPISQVRDNVAAAFRKEVEWQTTEKLLRYKLFCIRREVQAEIVQIESNDVENAIAKEIAKRNIDKLVVGASSTGGMFSRRKEDDEISTSSSSDITDQKSKESSFRSQMTGSHSWTTDQSSSLNASTDFSAGSQVNINYELQQLRKELRQVQGMYAKAQTEAIDASRKLNDLHEQRLEETIKLREIRRKEDEAKELAKQEKARYEAAKMEAYYARECVEKEAALKTAAEKKAVRVAKAKEKLESSLVGPVHHYQEFTWEEIASATSSFSNDLRVGMGSYGTVYKCNLRHTTAAVKILHSVAANRTKQFQQELEILSKIRHPNLLSLLGACPDRDCLVYEYMENGSLEERLFRKNNTPPIPWFDRYRIAREIASALIFLHNSKPKPIIHRDLKPANILLDHNFVSKIGDVGLSTMLLHSDTSNAATLYKDTSPVGTLCYIDPEYQRTGLVSPKSDVYAFGMVVLQLLTAKPAIALTRTVEMAIEDDRLDQILDSEAGNWPIAETKEFAVLALRCTELRHRDRPDLKSEILPA
ncbi:hypothetical protein DH2020_010160 [Rehmannia glutinosa]|uniref:RING-type E3 ubiquitin transferase n=1 Tax=Rehmannia glutinosa TaxID=99300 RepID=A0ABR0X8C7_REHGL